MNINESFFVNTSVFRRLTVGDRRSVESSRDKSDMASYLLIRRDRKNSQFPDMLVHFDGWVVTNVRTETGEYQIIVILQWDTQRTKQFAEPNFLSK